MDDRNFQEQYYKDIKKLNISHYTGEISYYSKTSLRNAEIVFLKDIKKGSKILDLGCGAGRFSINAARMGFDVVGFDIAPAVIQVCKKRAEEEKLLNTDFLIGDMSQLPFKDNFFDYVFCPRFSINAIATFNRRRKAVEEMIRVVKPNGKIFIESFNKLYLGKGPFLVLKNLIRDFWRHVKIIIICKIFSKKYKELLPGDIIYQANKVLTASKGYAHLPTIFELKRMLPKNKKVKFYSTPQIIEGRKGDILKFFRYSIWVIIQK